MIIITEDIKVGSSKSEEDIIYPHIGLYPHFGLYPIRPSVIENYLYIYGNLELSHFLITEDIVNPEIMVTENLMPSTITVTDNVLPKNLILTESIAWEDE